MEVINLKTKHNLGILSTSKHSDYNTHPRIPATPSLTLTIPSPVAGNHTSSESITNWYLTALRSFTTASSAALRSASPPILSPVRGGAASALARLASRLALASPLIRLRIMPASQNRSETSRCFCARCGVNVRNFICWACGYVLHKPDEYISCECEGEWTHPDERVKTQIPSITQLTPDGRPSLQRGTGTLNRFERGLEVFEGLEESQHCVAISHVSIWSGRQRSTYVSGRSRDEP